MNDTYASANAPLVSAIRPMNCGQTTSRLWSSDRFDGRARSSSLSSRYAVTSNVRRLGSSMARVDSVKSWLGEMNDRLRLVDSLAMSSGRLSSPRGETASAAMPTRKGANSVSTSQTKIKTSADVAALLNTTEHSNATASHRP